MKKILSLLSFLMLAVVAMAADLTTGVTFKGTWGDKLGSYGTAEGQMKVTKVDGGLKFEVKSNAFNGKRIRDAAFFLIIMLVTFAATLLKPQNYVSSRTIQKCVEHVSTST